MSTNSLYHLLPFWSVLRNMTEQFVTDLQLVDFFYKIKIYVSKCYIMVIQTKSQY